MVMMITIAVAGASRGLLIVGSEGRSSLVCNVMGLCDGVTASVDVMISHSLGIRLPFNTLATFLSVCKMVRAVRRSVLPLLQL